MPLKKKKKKKLGRDGEGNDLQRSEVENEVM